MISVTSIGAIHILKSAESDVRNFEKHKEVIHLRHIQLPVGLLAPEEINNLRSLDGLPFLVLRSCAGWSLQGGLLFCHLLHVSVVKLGVCSINMFLQTR